MKRETEERLKGQLVPVIGRAKVLHGVFATEEMEAFCQEVGDFRRINRLLPQGSANALPVEATLDRLRAADLGATSLVVEVLADIAQTVSRRLSYVASYAVNKAQFDHPHQTQLGVAEARLQVVTAGTVTYRIGGKQYFETRHMGGNSVDAVPGSVLIENNTREGLHPLVSAREATGSRITFDFLESPTPIIAPTSHLDANTIREPVGFYPL